MRMPHRLISPSRSNGGFTLIELMVTVTVGAIVLAVGIPSFGSFVAGQRVKTAGYDLSTALLLARSEAIKRNVDVIVAPRVSATGWSSGWTITSTGGIDIAEQVAFTGLTITRAEGGADSISFGRGGRPSAKATFSIASGANSRCVQLDLTGLPSTKNGACS